MGTPHMRPRLLLPSLVLVGLLARCLATRDALIQHAVQQLLGVPGERTRSSPDPTAVPPPHYMLQLYERYQNGDLRGTHSSNTVRSILASRGKLLGDDVLLFNLSGIHGNEDIVRAELHFFRKRRRRSATASSLLPRLRVQLLAVQKKERLQRLTSLEVKAPSSRGWQASDVTAGVAGMRKRSNFANAVLAARFEASGKRGHFRSLPARKLMVPGSTPFLIVFSNDSLPSLLDDDVAELDEEEHDVEALIRDGHNATALFLLARRARRHSRNNMAAVAATDVPTDVAPERDDGHFVNDNAEMLLFGTVGGKNQTGGGRRLPRRSLDDNTISEGDFNVDNELPEKFHPASSNRVPLAGPAMLLPRPRQPKHSRSGNGGGDGASSGKNNKHNNNNKNNGLIPRPPRRRTHSQRRPPKHTPLPKIWQEKFENEASVSPDDELQSVPCRRRKLVVEFSEIGWGEWIISPKAFEAHYCSGSCPFPLNKSVRPSNHATIQSLVHAIGLRAHVPAPCCVPDALSSLTLLYFDEDRNVVLKNYPAMTVESCACR